MSLVPASPFVCQNFVHQMELGLKKKQSLLFSGFLIIFYQNILFLKLLLAFNGCCGLFTDIKNGSGTSFWCTLSTWFFLKNIPYLILHQIEFQCLFKISFFFSPDIKQNLIKTTDYVINCKIYLWSSSKASWKEKKRGREKFKNVSISKTKSAF